MPDLRFRGKRYTGNPQPHRPKAASGAVPLELTEKTSSYSLISACGWRSSAAC